MHADVLQIIFVCSIQIAVSPGTSTKGGRPMCLLHEMAVSRGNAKASL